MRSVTCIAAGGIVLLGGANVARAQTVLQFDIDALSAEASGAFSETFTGTLDVFNTAARPDFDGDAKILDVLIDGTTQGTGGADSDAFGFLLTLSFSNGFITGGDLMVAVDQAGSENTYTASIRPSADRAILHIGGGVFLLGGLTFQGLFDNPLGSFLGVDVEPWGSIQPLPGMFSQIEFTPDADNRDLDTDVDVFVFVPTPAAAGMAALGLLGIATRRRR